MLPRRLSRTAAFAGVIALAAAGTATLAQNETAPESPAVAAPAGDFGGNYEVDGVTIDVTAKTADAARDNGWRIAQRKGWQMLSQRMGAGGGSLSDGALDAMVSGIIVEQENIGPNRYVARLGVLFNRGRASAILGVTSDTMRSPPMLLIPLQFTGGVGQAFEQHTDWLDAWARFRTDGSAINYVRPGGTGPDALLLNTGQINRPGRGWWRSIVQQYGASDVIMPVVRLDRQWPGGPVIGQFQARFGPDNRLIGQFALRVDNGDGIPVLLDAGVKRLDALYQQALQEGVLHIDPTMTSAAPQAQVQQATPDAQALDAAIAAAVRSAQTNETAQNGAISVQFDTPTAQSVSATESAIRAVPGVTGAVTTSLALGGVSVMRVVYEGDPALLRTSLETRGWTVIGSGTTLRIRRSPAPIATPATPTGENVIG
jgi:hypothetical protein